jgi:diguanylate cyclase (GGDEF)-like protein
MATILDMPGVDTQRLARRTRALEALVEIGIGVMTEGDLSSLIERVVLEARRFTNAEAGTLFIRRGLSLTVAVIQNDRLATSINIEGMKARLEHEHLGADAKSLAGFVASSGQTLRLADVHTLPANAPYEFNPRWDAKTKYRTQSALVIPLTDRAGNNVGVLELINALDDDGNAVAFAATDEQLVRALGTQATIAIDHARLTEMSFVDAGTGAYNRRYFTMRLDEEIKRHARHGEPFAVVIFDLDHFKSINDQHGHPVGDRALHTLGSLIIGQTRGSTVVARLGGDEFAAILPNTPKDGALKYAERIRRLLEAFPFEGRHLTISAGIAAAPDDVPTAELSGERLLQAADHALYAAKRAGRNRVASL